MTVVAWDGTTLAADKMTSFGGLHGTTIKVHKFRDVLIGGCGLASLIEEMVQWVKDGCDPLKFPAQQRDPKECVSLLVIRKGGWIHQYESTPYPLKLSNANWAIGSGRDFAMAAMFLGKTAREAVAVASALCNDCGNGIDELTHDD